MITTMGPGEPEAGGALVTIRVADQEFGVYTFRSPSEDRAREHVVKHVLGFMYEDGYWDREAWKDLLSSMEFDRDDLTSSLERRNCPLAQNRGYPEIRDRVCERCTVKPSTDCARLLGPLVGGYTNAIRAALAGAYEVPRFMTFMDNERDGQNGMYFVDNTGVTVVVHENRRHHVTSCFRPPPDLRDAKPTPKDYLLYAIERCRQKVKFKKIGAVQLFDSEHWGFSPPHPPSTRPLPHRVPKPPPPPAKPKKGEPRRLGMSVTEEMHAALMKAHEDIRRQHRS